MKKNNKVFQANLFAFILLALYVFTPDILVPLFNKLNLSKPAYIILPEVILLLIPTVIYFIVTKHSVKYTLNLRKIGLKSILIVIAVGLLAQPIMMFLSLISQFIFPNKISQVVTSINDIPFIVRLIMIAVTPAICEEITMRGVVLGEYENVDIKKAAVMSGLFFGMLHLDGNQFLYAFALGILFSYLVRITRSIYSSVICHFVINGTQLLLAGLTTEKSALSEGTAELAQEASLYSLSISEIISVVSYLLIISIICLLIIRILMRKLMRIHGYTNNTGDYIGERPSKVMNWPAYASIALYLFVMAGEVIELYF